MVIVVSKKMVCSMSCKIKHMLFVLFLSVLIIASLSSCGGHVYHRVERGETLYSIGWIYGYDYRQIAKWNDIHPPYILSPGRNLRVVPPRATPQSHCKNIVLMHGP